jgi:hypothetical protein
MRGSVGALPRPAIYAIKKPKGLGGEYQIAAGKSRCPCQLRLIYEFVRHTFISTSRSAAVPEFLTLG